MNRIRPFFPAIALLAACTAETSPPTTTTTTTTSEPPAKDLRELHALLANPTSCAGIDECPVGSYCDAKASLCAWDCYASSDCGLGRVCTGSGHCATPAAALAEPPRASRAPLVESAKAAGTTALGAACALDSDCAAGAFCSDATDVCTTYTAPGGTCHRDGECAKGSACGAAGACVQFAAPGGPCAYDEECGPTALCDALQSTCAAGCVDAKGCPAGQACGAHGRCIDPAAVKSKPHMTMAPIGVELRRATDTGTLTDRVKAVTLTLTTNDASYGAGGVVPHVFLTASPGSEIDCDPNATTAPTTGFAPTCSLQTWTFANVSGTRTASARVWIRLAANVAPLDQMWHVGVRSNDVDGSGGSIVVQLPEDLRQPAAYDGEYQGKLVLEGSDLAASAKNVALAALDIPIKATASSEGILLFDPTRQVSPSGRLFFSLKNAASSYYETWIAADPATPQSSEPLADVGRLSSHVTQEGATLTLAGGVLSGHVDVTLGLAGTKAMRWRFDLHRVADLTHASCAGGTACAPGLACDPRALVCVAPPPAAPQAPTADEDSLVEQRLATWTGAMRASVVALADAVTPANIYAPYVYNPTLAATPLLDGANVAGTTNLAQLGYQICQQSWSFTSPNAAYSIALGPRALVPNGRPATCANATAPTADRCDAIYPHVDAAWLGACGATSTAAAQDPSAVKRTYVPCLGAASDWQVPANVTCQNLYDDEFNPDSTQGSYADFLSKQCIPSPYDYVITTGGSTREIDTYLCPDAARLAFGWTNRNAELTACLTPGGSSLAAASPLSALVVINSGDLACATSTSTQASPSVLGEVPLVDQYRDVSSPAGTQNDVDDDAEQTYVECLADLARAVPPPTGSAGADLAAATAAQKCLNLGLFTASAESSRRTFSAYWLDLLRRWIAVHDFVGQQGRLEFQSARVLAATDPGNAPQGNDAILYDLLDRLDHGWDYVLQSDTSAAVTGLRGYVASNPDYRLGYAPSPASLQPDHEQAKTFSVALYDGMTSYLKVVETLIGELGAQAYAQCAAGNAPTEQVLARVGSSLRYVTSVERLAEVVASKNYASTQTLNILRARQELRSYKRRVTQEAANLASCKNPLGVDEQDLPLFFGDPADADGRYFASSDYLASLVQAEVGVATTALGDARTAWQNARTSRVQAQASAAQYQQRIEDLKVRYGTPVVEACGLTIDAQNVLDAFDPSDPAKVARLRTCFLADGCTADSTNASCFRGTLGEAILTIKAAKQDIDTARQSWQEAQDGYDIKFKECQSLSENLKKDEDLTKSHDDEIHNLRAEKQAADTVAEIMDAATACASGATASFGAACATAAGGAIAKGFSIDFQVQMDNANDEYVAQQRKLSNERDLMACFAEADQRRLGIQTAFMQISRRGTDAMIALVKAQNLGQRVLQSLGEGEAALAREVPRKLPSVAHHYWFEDKVLNYSRHFQRLQQLTFLELQAVEYEFQQSFPQRGGIVTAHTPDDLSNNVIVSLENVRRTRRAHGNRPGIITSVFSLQNDILGMTTKVDGTPLDPTLPNPRLGDRLKSPASAMYDDHGTYLGQAIPFHLSPDLGITPALVYGERLWALAATVEGDNLGPNSSTYVYLMKRNTFFSKWYPGSGTTPFQIGRYRPEGYLFASDAAIPNDDRDVREFTLALVNVPAVNAQRSDVAGWSGAALSDAIAGEGLFGDYVVLLPAQSPSSPTWIDLSQVEDVLVRFDYYAVAGSPR